MLNHLSCFVNGKATYDKYVQTVLFGSFLIGILVYSYHMDFMYSASSSDHALLKQIVIEGVCIATVLIGFSGLSLVGSLNCVRRIKQGKVLMTTLILLYLTFFVGFSALFIGSDIARAVEGLVNKKDEPTFHLLND